MSITSARAKRRKDVEKILFTDYKEQPSSFPGETGYPLPVSIDYICRRLGIRVEAVERVIRKLVKDGFAGYGDYGADVCTVALYPNIYREMRARVGNPVTQDNPVPVWTPSEGG